MDKLSHAQHVRIAALNAAALIYTSPGEFDGDDVVLETAKKFEAYIEGQTAFGKYQTGDRPSDGFLSKAGVKAENIQIFSTVSELSYDMVPGAELPNHTGSVISVAGEIDKHTHTPLWSGVAVPICRVCGLTAYLTKPDDPYWNVVPPR